MRRGRARGAGDVRLDRRARDRGRRASIGTKWKSALSELGVGLYRIMPTPPASLTARLLSTRALTPRSHSTILPVTLAGSSVPMKHSRTCGRRRHRPGPAFDRVDQRRRTARPGRRRRRCTWRRCRASRTWWTGRSWVLAATVVIHGRLCATVLAPGPLLPAEAATNTPAAAALKNASSTGSTMESGEPRDRVVDDVDAVGDRVVDRGDRVDRAPEAVAVGLVPADLVDGDAGRRRHAADACRPSTPLIDRRARCCCRRRWWRCASRGRCSRAGTWNSSSAIASPP